MSDHPFDQSVIDPYLAEHPHEILFLTGSGAHLYGFASPDSDYDLRGAHVTTPRELFRLDPPRETYEVLDRDAPVEMDIVTHDVRKYFKLLLSKNGYVLEQIFSPLVVASTLEFEELKVIAARTVTKHHHYHFESFSKNQWGKVSGPSMGTVKGLLYTYRPLLAGIHLMRTGRIESDINVLNETFRLEYINDLVARKRGGEEKQPLGESDMSQHEERFVGLQSDLAEASRGADLPDEVPSETREALNDLLVRIRMKLID